MTGFRQTLKDAVARDAIPSANGAATVEGEPTNEQTVRSWVKAFGNFVPGQPISLRLLIQDIGGGPADA
jgi:hypothetical protein